MQQEHTVEDTHPPDHQGSPGWDKSTKLLIGGLGFVLFLLAAYFFRVIFVPLILAGIVAYVLHPVVDFLETRLKLKRGLATALVFLVLIALMVPVLIVFVPTAIEQVIVMQRDVIEYVRIINRAAAEASTFEILGFQFEVQEIVTEVTSALARAVTGLASGTLTFVIEGARTVVFGIFTFVIAFYITRDSHKLIDVVLRAVPEEYNHDFEHLLAEIDGVWSAFFRGMVILSLTVMVLLTIISAILGLPNPVLLGVWGGLLEFIPSIGNIIWGLTAILVAIIEGSTYINLAPTAFVILVAAAYIAFSQIDMNLLIPNILGSQVQLNPALVLIGVIVGLTVGGVLGVALAAPTIASLRILIRYLHAKLFDLEPFPVDKTKLHPATADAQGDE